MRNKQAKRDRRDKLVGTILGVIGLVLIAALAGGAWWLSRTKVALDADNCPVSGPKAAHIIMIDRSDPISGQQAQRIRQHVNNLKNGASFGTRFDIYTFEGNTLNEFPPVLRVCAPGRPEEANEFIENPEFIRRNYEEKFSAVLDKAISSLLQVSSLPNSPIIESLRAASITSFGSVKAGSIPLHVTLVSDMIQNTAASSHFKSDPDFTRLSKTAAWPSLQSTLKGADVEILYLLRPNAKRGSASIQNRGHELFWENLIAASGGRVNRIEPI